MSKEKVVLAYSGGLDTTTLIPWLKRHMITSYLLLYRLRTGRRAGWS